MEGDKGKTEEGRERGREEEGEGGRKEESGRLKGMEGGQTN